MHHIEYFFFLGVDYDADLASEFFKFLGNVDVNGQSVAKSIRAAGFVPGVYMVRSVGQSKTFRVLVK